MAETKKKWYETWKLYVVIIIITALITAFAVVKLTEDDSQLEEPVEEKTNWLLWLFVLVILGGGGYFLYKKYNAPIDNGAKNYVDPDRAIEIFIDNFCLKHNITTKMDFKKKVSIPVNMGAIKEQTRREFYHRASGNRFYLFEFEVYEGDMIGVHTAILPTDQGEAGIKGGRYRLEPHINTGDFKIKLRDFPLASVQDKQDRLMWEAVRNSDEDYSPEELNKFMGGSNPSAPQESADDGLDEEEIMNKAQIQRQKRPYQKSKYSKYGGSQ